MIPYVVLTLAAAFTVHEVAHAYVAYKFGDETAKRPFGRLIAEFVSHIRMGDLMHSECGSKCQNNIRNHFQRLL